MSQENVEVVCRLADAFDERNLEAFVAEHHPDVACSVMRSAIEGPYRGHDGVRRMAREAFDAGWKMQIDEIRDCGERVLVLGRQGGYVGGVPPLDHVLAEVFEIEGGKVIRMQAFSTATEALKAVGLEE